MQNNYTPDEAEDSKKKIQRFTIGRKALRGGQQHKIN